MFDLEIKGLDEARESLRTLGERAELLGGSRSVPLVELFSTSFMEANTSFHTLQAMVDASGVFENLDDADEDVIREAFNGHDWSTFVATKTRFSGWEAMLSAGVLEYFTRQYWGGQAGILGERTITEEAAAILKAAAADDGHVTVTRRVGPPGVTVQAGRESMIPDDATHRTAMRWAAAVEDLEAGGLIRDIEAGSVFELTRGGYEAADQLGSRDND